jgi:8-oxo-dGTP pyrophosphatase MutT (NUDIX family)
MDLAARSEVIPRNLASFSPLKNHSTVPAVRTGLHSGTRDFPQILDRIQGLLNALAAEAFITDCLQLHGISSFTSYTPFLLFMPPEGGPDTPRHRLSVGDPPALGVPRALRKWVGEARKHHCPCTDCHLDEAGRTEHPPWFFGTDLGGFEHKEPLIKKGYRELDTDPWRLKVLYLPTDAEEVAVMPIPMFRVRITTHTPLDWNHCAALRTRTPQTLIAEIRNLLRTSFLRNMNLAQPLQCDIIDAMDQVHVLWIEGRVLTFQIGIAEDLSSFAAQWVSELANKPLYGVEVPSSMRFSLLRKSFHVRSAEISVVGLLQEAEAHILTPAADASRQHLAMLVATPVFVPWAKHHILVPFIMSTLAEILRSTSTTGTKRPPMWVSSLDPMQFTTVDPLRMNRSPTADDQDDCFLPWILWNHAAYVAFLALPPARAGQHNQDQHKVGSMALDPFPVRGPEARGLAPRVQLGNGLPISQFQGLPGPHVNPDGILRVFAGGLQVLTSVPNPHVALHATASRSTNIGASSSSTYPNYLFFPDPNTYVAQPENAWYTGSSVGSAAATWQHTLERHGLRTHAKQQEFEEWSRSQTGRIIDEFRMREEDNGDTWNPRQTTHFSSWYGAVVLCLLDGKQSVLVVRHKRRSGLEFPKGGEQAGDLCPYGTALRELKEETSLDLQGDGEKYHFWVNKSGRVTSATALAAQSGWLVFRYDKGPRDINTYSLTGEDTNNNPRFLDFTEVVRYLGNPQQYNMWQHLVTTPKFAALWACD